MESLLERVPDFFNSSFFVGLVTFFVGGFAIALYQKQKHDYKKDVSLLILQEIRYAEQQIRSSRAISATGADYPLASKLLPTNTWYKNIHLFMGDFEQSQIDAISGFYAKVEYMDRVVEDISDYKISWIENRLSIGGREQPPEHILPDRVHLDKIVKLLSGIFARQGASLAGIPAEGDVSSGQPFSFTPPVTQTWRLHANNILIEVSNKVEFIHNTSIGDRLREISRRKWLKIF